MKRLSCQVITFSIAGLVNNLIGYTTFYILTLIGFHIFTSSSIAFIAGALVSYMLNTRFTFSCIAERKSLCRFFIVQLAMLILFSAGSTTIYLNLVRNSSLAWLLSTIFVACINFLLQKHIVFNSKSI